MAPRIRPDDWDRLFAPEAPRRGGPLQATVTVIIGLLIVTILAGGVAAGLRARAAQQQAAALRPTPLPAVTAVATAAPTTEAPTAAAPATNRRAIARGGNLRSAPRVAADTVVGLVWPGDTFDTLEETVVGDARWLRIRVAEPAANRGGEGVAAGTEGWVSEVLTVAP